MLVVFSKDNKVLNVEADLKICVPKVLITEEELNLRTINKETVSLPLPAGITVKDGDGNEIYGIATLRDIVYNNKIMVLYSKVKKLLFVIPDVLDLLGAFENYTIKTVGTSLFSSADAKEENYAINAKTTNKHVEIDLDTSLLNTIKVESNALNIPGVFRGSDNYGPKYLTSVNNEITSYDNTYIISGLNIDFGDSILNSVYNASLLYGYDTRNIKTMSATVIRDVVKDKYKSLFILE